GAEEVAVLPWPSLFRHRLVRRVESSDRYEWWVLWTVLAGLFSVGFTITILAVSLPRIAADLHSDTTTLTWVITGPLLALGVVGGGPIVEHVSWRLIYIAQIPFTALALIAAAIILPGRDKAQRDRVREPLDVRGVITVGLGTVSLLFAMNRGPEWGWTSPG